MEQVYVTGVGMTKFGTLDETITELAKSAALEAIRDSNALDAKFDYVLVGSQNPDEFTGVGHLSTLITDHLGLVPAGATRVETGPSAGSSAFEEAVALVKSGLAQLVLVIGVEKMSGIDRGAASKILAKMISIDSEAKLGGTPAALAALVARRYMHDYGLSRDDLSLIPVKAHKNGAKNPLAHFREEIALEKVSASKMVADPLTLYDCSPTSDGAASVIVASSKAAKTLGRTDDSVKVLAVGHATDYHAVQHRPCLTSLNATVSAAGKAFKMARLRPEDIDVCELHDAFSILELIDMEDVGLVKPGHAIDLVKQGETAIGGRIPVNTTGGLKARGHPTGATGVAQIRDVALQIRGKAPAGLQVKSPEFALTHNIGGFGNNMVVCIFGR
ncbi:MAG: acetyl-CoA acetyltransferase [Candidatus Thorarchaeota archaeon]|nr:MAG: acetyl-CoA acetyltransferase [Candidatus Thorarchaeota archaeon]